MSHKTSNPTCGIPLVVSEKVWPHLTSNVRIHPTEINPGVNLSLIDQTAYAFTSVRRTVSLFLWVLSIQIFTWSRITLDKFLCVFNLITESFIQVWPLPQFSFL